MRKGLKMKVLHQEVFFGKGYFVQGEFVTGPHCLDFVCQYP